MNWSNDVRIRKENTLSYLKCNNNNNKYKRKEIKEVLLLLSSLLLISIIFVSSIENNLFSGN